MASLTAASTQAGKTAHFPIMLMGLDFRRHLDDFVKDPLVTGKAVHQQDLLPFHRTDDAAQAATSG
jgi:hypothetical protein